MDIVVSNVIAWHSCIGMSVLCIGRREQHCILYEHWSVDISALHVNIICNGLQLELLNTECVALECKTFCIGLQTKLLCMHEVQNMGA
jgi:hypothetical protein